MPILKRSPIKNFNGRVANWDFFSDIAVFPSTTMVITFSKSGMN